MPVPSSGELKLRADIALEVDGSATGDNVSLGTLSNTAGFTEPDSMSEFYGYSACTVPSVTTNSMSGVGVSSMTAHGNVSSDNGCAITQRGFYFGTSSNYASNTKYTVSGTTGAFIKGFTGLSSSTTYYSTAYAINSEGEARGSTVSATTSTPITYTFQTNNSMYRETETGNYAVWYGGYSRSYGQYSHSQLGWQTRNSCINGSITNDGYSPSSGLPSSKCSSNGKSVAYFPITNTPSVRPTRVYSQHGGTAINGACCYDNYIAMGGSGSSLSNFGGGSNCSYSYSSTYCGSSNLNAGPTCTNAGSSGCPTNTGCGCAFVWTGTVTLS